MTGDRIRGGANEVGSDVMTEWEDIVAEGGALALDVSSC